LKKLTLIGDKVWEPVLEKGFGSKYVQQAKNFDSDSISSA